MHCISTIMLIEFFLLKSIWDVFFSHTKVGNAWIIYGYGSVMDRKYRIVVYKCLHELLKVNDSIQPSHISKLKICYPFFPIVHITKFPKSIRF